MNAFENWARCRRLSIAMIIEGTRLRYGGLFTAPQFGTLVCRLFALHNRSCCA